MTPVTMAYRTTPSAQASVCRPSYILPMMSSGAAYSSEPQRVARRGDAGLTKRESPKSVNLTKGVGSVESTAEGDAQGNGRAVRRISGRAKHVSSGAHSACSAARTATLTFELDVTVHETDLVHPADCRQQLAKDSPREAFRKVRVPAGEEIEELAAVAVFQDECRVDRRGERAEHGDQRRMLNGLRNGGGGERLALGNQVRAYRTLSTSTSRMTEMRIRSLPSHALRLTSFKATRPPSLPPSREAVRA
jgi:hypothetical protein